MLKAKFHCTSVTKSKGYEKADLMPVYGNSPENNTYSAATPSRRLELNITNPEALEFFQPGGEYYLDIRKAE